MARGFDGSTQYLEYGGAVLTAYPFTMACWFNVANITGDHYLMSIADLGTGTNYWTLVALGSVAGDPVSFVSRSGGSGNRADTSAGFAASTWTHACGVGTSATSRNSYINGGSAGSNTTSSTPAGLDNTGIGQVHTSGGHIGIPLGSVAEAAIWSVALDTSEIAALAGGVSPLLVRPSALVAHWPLIGNFSPEIDVRGRNEMTVTGAAKAAHPRIIYPDGMPVSGMDYIVSPGGIVIPVFDHHYRMLRTA